jgi:hypothetical protein
MKVCISPLKVKSRKTNQWPVSWHPEDFIGIWYIGKVGTLVLFLRENYDVTFIVDYYYLD